MHQVLIHPRRVFTISYELSWLSQFMHFGIDSTDWNWGHGSWTLHFLPLSVGKYEIRECDHDPRPIPNVPFNAKVLLLLQCTRSLCCQVSGGTQQGFIDREKTFWSARKPVYRAGDIILKFIQVRKASYSIFVSGFPSQTRCWLTITIRYQVTGYDACQKAGCDPGKGIKPRMYGMPGF